MPFRLAATIGLLPLLAVLGPAGGCGGGQDADEPRYVIISNGDSPFWDACHRGMTDAGEDLGVRVDMLRNDGSAGGQIEKLRQVAALGNVVGVAVSVVEEGATGVAEEMRRLRSRGIHVITIDSDVAPSDLDARYAFVGSDNYEGGVTLGRAARQLRPDGGRYIAFVGLTGAQNARERIAGFADGAGPGFEAVAPAMADSTDRTRARQNVTTAIQNHPELDTLVGIWSYNAPAIVDVVDDLGRRDDFTIVAFDAEIDAVNAMDEGMIDALVVQNPYQMGYQSIRLLRALHDGDEATVSEILPDYGEEGGDHYNTGLKVVVPDASSPIQRDAFGAETEFMTLDEFREWLEQHGLGAIGS